MPKYTNKKIECMDKDKWPPELLAIQEKVERILCSVQNTRMELKKINLTLQNINNSKKKTKRKRTSKAKFEKQKPSTINENDDNLFTINETNNSLIHTLDTLEQNMGIEPDLDLNTNEQNSTTITDNEFETNNNLIHNLDTIGQNMGIEPDLDLNTNEQYSTTTTDNVFETNNNLIHNLDTLEQNIKIDPDLDTNEQYSTTSSDNEFENKIWSNSIYYTDKEDDENESLENIKNSKKKTKKKQTSKAKFEKQKPSTINENEKSSDDNLFTINETNNNLIHTPDTLEQNMKIEPDVDLNTNEQYSTTTTDKEFETNNNLIHNLDTLEQNIKIDPDSDTDTDEQYSTTSSDNEFENKTWSNSMYYTDKEDDENESSSNDDPLKMTQEEKNIQFRIKSLKRKMSSQYGFKKDSPKTIKEKIKRGFKHFMEIMKKNKYSTEDCDIISVLEMDSEGNNILNILSGSGNRNFLKKPEHSLFVRLMCNDLIESWGNKYPPTDHKINLAKCIVNTFPSLVDKNESEPYKMYFNPTGGQKNSSTGFIANRFRSLRRSE